MIFILSILFSYASVNDAVQADLFDLESKNKLFTYEAHRTYSGDASIYESTYRDVANGEVVASEKAELRNGDLVRYSVERKSTNETGVIEVREGKVLFIYNDNGKKSEGKESLKEPTKEATIVSANLIPFAENKMADLLAKKDVDFRYAVWYRKETVGFRLSYEREEGSKVVIKMNPTNFLYKSLVKPLYLTFDKTNKKLLEIRGRTLPKKKEGSAWRDIDVLSVYK